MNPPNYCCYVGYNNGKCIKRFSSWRKAQQYLATFIDRFDVVLYDIADYPSYN